MSAKVLYRGYGPTYCTICDIQYGECATGTNLPQQYPRNHHTIYHNVLCKFPQTQNKNNKMHHDCNITSQNNTIHCQYDIVCLPSSLTSGSNAGETDAESNSDELEALKEWSSQLPTFVTSECHTLVADDLNSPASSYLSDCADIHPAGKT